VDIPSEPAVATAPDLWQGFIIPKVQAVATAPYNIIPDNLMDKFLNQAEETLLGPQDSVSDLSLPFTEPLNPMLGFSDLKLLLSQGWPRPYLNPPMALLLHICILGEAHWFHMRGFGKASDKWPKADQMDLHV
jgi:hypothetical protein